MYKILVINPGSTSTKIAVYEDDKPLFVESLEHDPKVISGFPTTASQYEFRRDVVLDTLAKHGVKTTALSLVMARGGLLPPVESGAYLVNKPMLKQLEFKPVVEHASNLAAMIGYAIAEPLGINCYIYDAVTVDEMEEINRITGIPEIRRKGMGHNLNMRASAIRHAAAVGKDYNDLTMIIVHMGGGSSLSIHHKGRIVDFISDDEGPFSPERAGGLMTYDLLKMVDRMGGDTKAVIKHLRGKSGLVAYFGTTEARDVEAKIKEGDQQAALVYEAMALNIAKNIAKLSVVVSGKVDYIILTGGLARSQMLTDWITERSKFIAPVVLMPGENEMESLALGGLRVLKGEEKAKTFVSKDFPE